MPFNTPSPHDLMLTDRRSIMADALTDAARQRRERAENASALNHARHVGQMPMDPTAGDVRRSFYETLRLRGE